MSILFKVLNLFGIPLEDGKSLRLKPGNPKPPLLGINNKVKKLTLFWLIVFNVYFVHLCLGPVFYAYRMRSLTEMFFCLSDSFRYGCALLSFNFVIRRHARFNQLRRFVKSDTKSTTKLKVFVVVSCLLSLIFCLTDLLINYIEIFESEQSFDENIDLYFYNITALKDYKRVGGVLSVIDVFVYILVTSGVRILLYVYVVSLCGIFAVEMEQFVKNLKVLVMKRKSRVITTTHNIFLIKANKIGQNFGFLYFVWLSDWMETFFTDIPKLVHFRTVSANKSVTEILIVVTPLIYSFISSLAVTFSFARVEEAQDKIITEFQILLASLKTNDMRFENELCFINTKLCATKVRVTFYKFLTVSKLFILNLYSFVSTFTVVAIQKIVAPII